jgi:predicted amidohydrolase
MKVALVQHDIEWCDAAANRARLGPRIVEAAAQGARLALLSETFTTGFATNRAVDVAERAGGPTEEFLRSSARANNIWVGATYFELPVDDSDPRPFNTFVLIGPDGTTHRYRKIHRFGYGGETEQVRAGSEHVIATIEGVRVALFICYDLRFADEFWAVGPDIDAFLIPANWPSARGRHWQALIVARAIENQAYVVACNRVGEGDGVAYGGDSMVVDPLGRVLASLPGSHAGLSVVDIDPRTVADVRRDLPFLNDRRGS